MSLDFVIFFRDELGGATVVNERLADATMSEMEAMSEKRSEALATSTATSGH